MESEQDAKQMEDKMPEVTEDPDNAILGDDEPSPVPLKKRKRDKDDTGEKGSAASGFEAPKLSKEDGGPSELKKIRKSVASGPEELLGLMDRFKGTVTRHAKKLSEKFEAEGGPRSERIKTMMAQQEAVTGKDWLDQLSNMTVYLLHAAGLHNKLVDNVLQHMGLIMEDLAPTIEEAIKIYDELTRTTKHLCSIIHDSK